LVEPIGIEPTTS